MTRAYIQTPFAKTIGTILLVEDDPNDVFLFQHAMKQVGIQNPLRVATDGQEAIDYLSGLGKFEDRELYPLPCLLLLDLKLPFLTGLDVLKWIRQQLIGEKMVVIPLSASGREVDIASAYDLGERLPGQTVRGLRTRENGAGDQRLLADSEHTSPSLFRGA